MSVTASFKEERRLRQKDIHMQPIIYDVAVSLDGFIAGPDGDILLFAQDGQVVEDYAARLATYKTALMGRATYEFGFQYGLEAGQDPYPHMETLICSSTLGPWPDGDVSVLSDLGKAAVQVLKQRSSGPIYLCGGGAFAGWMMPEAMIDRIVLKRAPCYYGNGLKLFADMGAFGTLTRVANKEYRNGYLLEEFIVPDPPPSGAE